jgi:uncharacterized protein YacL
MYKNTKQNNKDKELNFRNACFGIVAGFIISLIETITTYDTLVSKTNKLMSLNSILHKSTDQFIHGIIFFILGGLICLLTKSMSGSTNIPLWSNVVGLVIGFIITIQIIKLYHSNLLNN